MLAFVAGFRTMAVGAIDGLGEKARQGGLPGTARTGQEISLADAGQLESIGERGDDVFLSDDLSKSLRAVFTVESSGRHRKIKIQKEKMALKQPSESASE